MYVFVLTLSYLCREQSAIVADNHGCRSPATHLMPVPIAQERVVGYFASQPGCTAAGAEGAQRVTRRMLDFRRAPWRCSARTMLVSVRTWRPDMRYLYRTRDTSAPG